MQRLTHWNDKYAVSVHAESFLSYLFQG